MPGIGQAFKGMALWEASEQFFKGLGGGCGPIGCVLGIAIFVLFGMIMAIGSVRLVLTGWASLFESMSKKPSLINGLFLIMALMAICLIVVGAAEEKGWLFMIGFGYLCLAGLSLGIKSSVDHDKNERKEDGVVDRNYRK